MGNKFSLKSINHVVYSNDNDMINYCKTIDGINERYAQKCDINHSFSDNTRKEMSELLNEDGFKLFGCSDLDGFNDSDVGYGSYYADLIINESKYIRMCITHCNGDYEEEINGVLDWEREGDNFRSFITYYFYGYQQSKIFTFHYSELKNELAFAIQNNKSEEIIRDLVIQIKLDKYNRKSRKQTMLMSCIQMKYMLLRRNLDINYLNKKIEFFNKLFHDDIKINIIERFVHKYVYPYAMFKEKHKCKYKDVMIDLIHLPGIGIEYQNAMNSFNASC